jgi:hypothetical protein
MEYGIHPNDKRMNAMLKYGISRKPIIGGAANPMQKSNTDFRMPMSSALRNFVFFPS